MFQVRLMLGDKDANASEGAVFERRDPISGEVVSQAAAASVADAQAAANAAAAAFPGWSNTSPSQRRAVLSRAADLLVERTPEFVKAMTLETGAAPMWGAFNCKLAAGMLREAAALTTQITGEVIPSDKPGFIAMALRQPAGVCVGIAPWNAPVILGVRAIAVPLACGNTVVLKSAEMCPMTHWLIASVLRAAGLPPGAVNVISNAPQDAKAVVDALIAHPAVRRVNFTGSTRVGRLVAQSCALHLKPVLLEL
ncbi:MAG: aldehyde dehydrogenase family protein, partial [Alphaproteobacteria bacterium]|nr:aldehyde dehydrogenase family protein [Alphaproteobacteria bacterium]